MLDLPIHIVRPFLGARVLKTGLAVFAAILLFHWIDPRFAVTAGIPAFLAVQPSVVRSGKAVRSQMLGNIMGALIAGALGYWLGPHPATMALGVIMAIVLLPRIGLVDSVVQAVVMVLVVLDQPDTGFVTFSALRIASVFGGTLVGYLVNRFVLPPDYGRPFQEALREASAQVDRLSGRVQAASGTHAVYPQEQVKSDVDAIHQQLGRARLCLDLLREDQGDDSAGLQAREGALVGLGAFTERLVELHRTAAQAGGLTEAEREAVTAALAAVTAYKSAVLEQVLIGTAPAPDPGAPTDAALQALEALVLQMVESEQSRARGLCLHTMLSTIRHMLWQVRQVERPGQHGGGEEPDAVV